jgi:predicted RNA methylase
MTEHTRDLLAGGDLITLAIALLGAATIIAVSRLRVKVETSSTRSQNFNQ